MERIRRQRVNEEPARISRKREQTQPLDTAGPFPVKWVQYKTSRCLYIGKHLFGIVSPAPPSPHIAAAHTWVGNVNVAGICGPVAYGSNAVSVQNEIKRKAMEWLAGFTEHAPEAVGVEEHRGRRRT